MTMQRGRSARGARGAARGAGRRQQNLSNRRGTTNTSGNLSTRFGGIAKVGRGRGRQQGRVSAAGRGRARGGQRGRARGRGQAKLRMI
jgi:hypothetical protein